MLRSMPSVDRVFSTLAMELNERGNAYMSAFISCAGINNKVFSDYLDNDVEEE